MGPSSRGWGTPSDATPRDFNGDGIPDVAIVSFDSAFSGFVSVLPGKGDGTFGAPVFSLGGTAFAGAVTVADFNGDGKPDLLFGEAILLGNGDGTFRYTAGIGFGVGVGTVGDFNGDGLLDLAVVQDVDILYDLSPSVAIFLGNGDATFGPPATFFGGISPFFAAVGDFNGDGKPDLAVLNAYYIPTDFICNYVTLLMNTSP